MLSRALRRRVALAQPIAEIADPVLRRVMSQRGLTHYAEQPSLADLLSWERLKGATQAAALLCEAIAQQQRILVVGDYDADGATGVALLVSALRQFGAQSVEHLVPDRVRMGYGLSPALAELALTRKPDLVLTVDNGISSVAGVAVLREQRVRVVITDHHLPGEQLPLADAIVNPNQPGCDFPSKALAGVGVAFYLMLALRALLRDDASGADQLPNMAQFLDLVAVGTVADLVPLDRNNRLLVQAGLRRMQAGYARPGLAALMDVSGREPGKLNEQDFGFALGPRINAAGRLEHMDCGIACLLAESRQQAEPLARQLDQINRQRRELQSETQELAAAKLPANVAELNGLSLFDARWHEGIVGLVASRLKEQLHRPVFAFAGTSDGRLKGSGRSISGFHLRDALARIDSLHPGLIEKFGGHAMAAGLSLPAGGLERFRAAFEAVCAELLDAETLTAVWLSDGELKPEELSAQTAQALIQAGPWGQAWEKPQFDGQFKVLSQRIVGQGHLKLRLDMVGRNVDAIAFGVDEPLSAEQVHLVYELDLNDYYSPARLQLIVRGMVCS